MASIPMRRAPRLWSCVPLALALLACPQPATEHPDTTPADAAGAEDASAGASWIIDEFADLQILRYEVPGFDALDLQRKQLLYYLYEAALCGRDIIYDQKYAGNLDVRRTLEALAHRAAVVIASDPAPPIPSFPGREILDLIESLTPPDCPIAHLYNG